MLRNFLEVLTPKVLDLLFAMVGRHDPDRFGAVDLFAIDAALVEPINIRSQFLPCKPGNC